MANEDIFTSMFAPPEGKGTIGHAMDFLSAINAPNRALYGGIMGGLSNDPNDTFWEGMKKGWQDKTDYSLADVLGLQKPTSEDDWLNYIAKGIPYLGAAALGDPLNLLFASAKGAGIVGKGIKALGIPEGRSIAGLLASPVTDPLVEKIAASSLGKAFMHGTGNEAMDLANMGRTRQLGEAKQFVDQQKTGIAAKLAEMGLTPERNPEIFNALEWGADALPKDVPASVLDLFKPLQDYRQGKFDLENQLLQSRRMEPIPNITGGDYTQLPHIRTDLPPSKNPEARTLFRWNYLDEPGAQVVDNLTGKPFVSSEKSKYLGAIKKDSATGGYIDTATGRAVDKTPQVGLGDILGADIGLKPEQFVTDPAAALGMSTLASQKRINFLQMLEEGEKAGLIRPVENAPDNFRAINIPRLKDSGLSEMAFEPKYANFLENQAKGAFDRSTPIGAIGDTLQRFNESYLGDKLKSFTDFWKSTILPLHPGWHAGNAASNEVQMYLGGVEPWMVPVRNAQAAAVQMGKGKDLIPGVDLLHEADIRGIERSGLFGSTKAETANGPGILDRIEQYPAGNVATAPFRGLGKAQDVGYAVGGAIENNAKLGVFIDQLMKTMPDDFATLGKEAQAKLMDAAALNAHTALIDYSAATPFEKQLLSIIPFYKWQRGIAGRTADVLANDPGKLSALGRTLDTFMTPMPNEDKNIMDPWAKEQSPITGILGHSFGADERGMPQMALAGRFLPHGNIEQFLKRPMDFLESIVNPAIKTPMELGTNYSSFKNRNIDELSGGFPGSVINPIIGGPYQEASQQQFGHTLPAAYDYLLTQMPGGRYLNELNQAGRAAGLWEDKYKEPNADMSTFASWYLTGGKQYPFDKQAAFQRRVKEQDKQAAAIKHDLNFATMKGDTDRMNLDFKLMMDNEKTKAKALGFLEN